jgi:DNA anti-recombination protein RmuC
MSKTSQDELTRYIRQIGEHINRIYGRLKSLESKLDTLTQEMSQLQGTDTVAKSEFTDFVNQLTASLKELLPPIPDTPIEEQSTDDDLESLY